MIYFVIMLALVGGFILYQNRTASRKEKQPFKTPEKWQHILEEKVDFYRHLDPAQRARFESDVHHFLTTVKITGVQTEVDLTDRLLVASSAVIPLFGFPVRTYSHLNEVLLYPASFDHHYEIGSEKEFITGMVGNGPMEGKMILSKPALHTGFDIVNDRKNVGIHEFVHLFDKETGQVDGIPPGFENKTYALPWVNMIHDMTREIVQQHSDIDGYATTNRQEFFAVAGEYFFEQPHLLKKRHPELYESLSRVFHQDLAALPEEVYPAQHREVGRNEPCPCGSGKKYKKCCMNR